MARHAQPVAGTPERQAIALRAAKARRTCRTPEVLPGLSDPESLSSLIGEIYDAALDPARWPAILRHAARFLPGQAAALISKDLGGNGSGTIYYDDGSMDPRFQQLYFQKYVKADPSSKAHVFAEVGVPVSTVDFMSHAEFNESRFYREWARPQGFVDFACAVLDKSATGAALFGVLRHERHGIVDEETLGRMRLIVPHIRRAALIGKAIEQKTAEAATLADTLDGIAAAMLLVDAKGVITHANVAGRGMLEAGDVVRDSGGRLVPYDAQANQALGEILSSSGSDQAIGIKGIALPMMARSDERYVAHILPLTSGARRRAGSSYAAVAAVFVQKAALDTRSPLEVIARAYKLTPTELRVLIAVAEVGGVQEVADALGIAETTVKFHLRSLFEKTNTHRQADLVKVLASYSKPLAG